MTDRWVAVGYLLHFQPLTTVGPFTVRLMTIQAETPQLENATPNHDFRKTIRLLICVGLATLAQLDFEQVWQATQIFEIKTL